jgi:hypothetical protein
MYLTGTDLGPIMVDAIRRPAYYDFGLADGSRLSSIVQHLGRDALGVVPNNYCSYFAENDQCRFCEIEPSFRAAGSYPRMRKPVQIIVDSLNLAFSEPTARYLIMTAGNLRRNDRTAEYYCSILRGLRDGAHGRVYRYASIMAPESFNQIDALRGAGLDGLGFNLEFYEPGQFARLAPGKAKYGRERLLAALEYAVGVFGRGHVFSNLIFGIQTWHRPGVDIDFDREIDMCLAATSGLLGRGVVPLFTLYHYSGKNEMGPVALRADAVIDFHLRYARLVSSSQILPAGRTGVLFNVGTIANHVCNDAVAAIRQQDLQTYLRTGDGRTNVDEYVQRRPGTIAGVGLP